MNKQSHQYNSLKCILIGFFVGFVFASLFPAAFLNTMHDVEHTVTQRINDFKTITTRKSNYPH